MLRPFYFYPNKKKALRKLFLFAMPTAVCLAAGVASLIVIKHKDEAFGLLFMLSIFLIIDLFCIVREIPIILRKKPFLIISDNGIEVDFLFHKRKYKLSDISCFDVEYRKGNDPWITIITDNKEVYRASRDIKFLPLGRNPYTIGKIYMERNNVDYARQYNMLCQYLCEYYQRAQTQQMQQIDGYVDANEVDSSCIAENIEVTQFLNRYEKKLKRSPIFFVIFFLVLIATYTATAIDKDKDRTELEQYETEELNKAIADKDSLTLVSYVHRDSLRAFLPLAKLQYEYGNPVSAIAAVSRALQLAKGCGADATEIVALRNKCQNDTTKIFEIIRRCFVDTCSIDWQERCECYEILGACYEYGIGVPQNNNEAITYYQKAVNLDKNLFHIDKKIDCLIKQDKNEKIN